LAVLGISGVFATEADDLPSGRYKNYFHDAAACLVSDGTTLAAIEEERLSREKHTNRFPEHAIRACIQAAGLRTSDIQKIAYFYEESATDAGLAAADAQDPLLCVGILPAREAIATRVSTALGFDVSSVPVRFVPHHDAHAASAFYDSTFESSLVVIADGSGELDSLTVYGADGSGLSVLESYSKEHSLGHFYESVTQLVGFRPRDEYKVMGLASFGDPAPWRADLERLYHLGPNGSYRLHQRNLVSALFDARGYRARRAGEPLENMHRDLAAAAQEVVERIMLHVVRYWLRESGFKRLCLAGGVAQNTSMNGHLLRLPELDEIYVPAAAHDAGAALGAAMMVDRADAKPSPSRRYSSSAYLGPSVGVGDEVRRELRRWGSNLRVESEPDIADRIAGELANGAVVGWAQGRSEFGPRALGNRSILADPRPAENRSRINGLIKKREDFRPFAPVVLAAHVLRYFDLPHVSADHSFMGYVIPVRPDARQELGAVTHVDGTARVQVLAPGANPLFERLIERFGDRVGTYVLLNTSFNNYAEPIVQSVSDAVLCLLTTGLSMIALDRFCVSATPEALERVPYMQVELMPHCQLSRSITRLGSSCAIVRQSNPLVETPVSLDLCTMLFERRSLGDLELNDSRLAEIAREIWSLYDARLLRPILPAA
jgi:predicted NodU family carbamoyl transferase